MNAIDSWLSRATGAPMGSARLTMIIVATILFGQASCAGMQTLIAQTTNGAADAARIDRYNKRNVHMDKELASFKRLLCAIAKHDGVATGGDCVGP